MIRVAFVAATLLSCVNQLYAVHTFDADITAKVLAETQAGQSYVTQFSGMTAWLVSASPDDEFGRTETYHLTFNESCGNLVLIYITQVFTNGTETKHTHAMIKENDQDYYYEPGYGLYLNFFVCDADLVVGYKSMKSADGMTLFLIIGPYGKTADEMDVASCKAKVSAIYPEAEFKDMSYPGTVVVPAKPSGDLLPNLLPGLLKGVGRVVDRLL